MSLFETKNYASIVAPLRKMVKDLASYIAAQETQIVNLELERVAIETKVSVSTSEIEKSNFTTKKINEMIAVDIDEYGNAYINDDQEEDQEEDSEVSE